MNFSDAITNLQFDFAVDALHRQSTVADHLARRLQARRSKAEAIVWIALFNINPAPHARFVKAVRIVPHNIRIRQYGIQCVEILRNHFVQKQPLGFDDGVHVFSLPSVSLRYF